MADSSFQRFLAHLHNSYAFTLKTRTTSLLKVFTRLAWVSESASNTAIVNLSHFRGVFSLNDGVGIRRLAPWVVRVDGVCCRVVRVDEVCVCSASFGALLMDRGVWRSVCLFSFIQFDSTSLIGE